MIKIDEAVKYFGDCNSKHLRRFSEITPKNNLIKGWICHNHNKYLGSLLIDEVNGNEHEQYIQSMPKIEYFNDERDICLNSEICGYYLNDAIAYEKLDGSCLIIYPLIEDGVIKEIIPKTRGRAVADSYFLELFDKVDKSSIYDYYRNNTGVLFFEMYGILNQHEIIHYQTGIDLVLIGVYDEQDDYKFAIPYKLWLLAMRHGFKQPDELFKIKKNYVDICTNKYRWYFKTVLEEDKQAPTVIDAVSKIQSFLEYLNNIYMDSYGRYATEGVVVNCINSKGHQKYIKIKPKDIENKHRGGSGIPRSDIVKEVLKYFDDYGSEVDEIYRENKNHHTEYLHDMLLESYPEQIILKSKKKIEKIFMQIWENKQIPQSIHNIADELFSEYSDEGISNCMRMFAQKYPYKKKDAKTVYNVLEKLYVKNKIDLNGNPL